MSSDADTPFSNTGWANASPTQAAAPAQTRQPAGAPITQTEVQTYFKILDGRLSELEGRIDQLEGAERATHFLAPHSPLFPATRPLIERVVDVQAVRRDNQRAVGE